MANWETFTIRDIVAKIKDDQIVLPVIQRDLVWDMDKMSLLFDSLLKGNAIGAIICIEEEKNTEPLFAFRKFTNDGNNTQSVEVVRLPKGQLFVIDGQQRLQSIYIGLAGTYHGQRMFFDLFSDYVAKEFEFVFSDESKDAKSLPHKNKEERQIDDTLWYPVDDLFQRLADTNDDDQVADEIVARMNITSEDKSKYIKKNIDVFFKSVFTGNSIGISKVSVNKTQGKIINRQRIVELFRRLNDGGTRLSAYDLVASMLKGFDSKMEPFLRQLPEKYKQIGLNQDNLLKTLLILRDLPNKEVTDLSAEDADFAVKNRERIEKTFEVLRQFLTLGGLSAYYETDKNRSFIPLYFLAYHIFHSERPTDKLIEFFGRFDTNDPDFRSIRRWIHLSLLNNVFRSRGSGWIPYKTGVKKIHKILQEHKSKQFPDVRLFTMYRHHPLQFNLVSENTLRSFDQEYLFYLLYGCQPTFRKEDIDHVHPKSKLADAGVEWVAINNVANFQLLEAGTNRGEKNNKELYDWITSSVAVDQRDSYLDRHCIPTDEKLWQTDKFSEFLLERQKLIVKKLNDFLT